MSRYYHSHPAYDDYPVVNISRKAAQDYCTWRTEQYNSDRKRKYNRVIFRLPTADEWREMAAKEEGAPFPWTGLHPYEIDKKGDTVALANVKIWNDDTQEYHYVFDGYMYTAPVGRFGSNDLGVYDVIGNVAELTQDGLIVGGSWFNTPEESSIQSTQDMDPPHPCVGFRVVMEVVER